MAAFEIFRDGSNDFRWRLRANNHRVIADSAEGYRNRADCEHGIALVREATDPEFYQDGRGEYRWRLRASNGRIIADSGEGYLTAAGSRRGFAAVRRAAPIAVVAG
jgi:uncharacterized protein YegP (UPF0339 family)